MKRKKENLEKSEPEVNKKYNIVTKNVNMTEINFKIS